MGLGISHENEDQQRGTGISMGTGIRGGIGKGSKDQKREWGSALGMDITRESGDYHGSKDSCGNEDQSRK